MSIYAVFIGGYHASQNDVDMWRISAAKQRDDVTFDAFPYPASADWSDTGAVNGFKKQFDGAIKQLEASGADTFFIVGHSSGCAIANELNARLKGDHAGVTLVDLDGFAPSGSQIKNSKVHAWCAHEAGGEGKSVHWADWKKQFTAANASQPWSLHFSMVNTAATDAITNKNYTTQGYAGCIANLCWLPKKP